MLKEDGPAPGFFRFLVSSMASSLGLRSIRGMNLSPTSSPFSVMSITCARSPWYLLQRMRTQLPGVTVRSSCSIRRRLAISSMAEDSAMTKESAEKTINSLANLLHAVIHDIEHTEERIALERG